MLRSVTMLFVAALAAAACSSEKKAAPAPTPAPSAGGGGQAGDPRPAEPKPAEAEPAQGELTARAGGPSLEACEKWADHTGQFVAESLLPPGASDDKKQAAAEKVKQDRPNRLRFCVQALEPREVECGLQAVDFPALAACEKFRRQVPSELTKRNEVTAEDCERFFVRYKQFMMNDGVPGERIEKDKDQIVRTCLEKAKPGTIACFITASTYEEAKRCP